MDHALPAADILPPRARIALNAAAPAIGVMALNAVAMIAGWGANVPVFKGVDMAPPAWITGIAWLLVYAALGLARWEACRASDRACDRSRWVTALLVWSVAYAFLGDAFGPVWSLAHAASLLTLGAVAAIRVTPASPRAGIWLLGALAWLGWVTVLSVRALQV